MLSALSHVVLDLYINSLAATLDGYVLDSSRHVNARITPDLAEWALTGGHSLSGYMAARDGDRWVTSVAALDLDDATLDDGRRLVATLAQHDIHALLVESRRGCHVWTFPIGVDWLPVPVGPVVRALRAAASLSGLSGPKVEVFPKPSGSTWGVGALRMPLMPHPKSGLVYPAHTTEGETIDRVADLVNHVAGLNTPFPRFQSLAGSHAPTVDYPRHLGAYAVPSRVDPHDGPTITSLLALLGAEVHPGHSIRCPFHRDEHASLSVARDDRRAWCKAPHCPIHNGGRGLGSLALRTHMSQKESLT